MTKKLKKISLVCLLLILTFYWPSKTTLAENLSAKLKGRILLQVESHGEAWYLNPDNLERYYLGRPADAFKLMQQLGLGISNADFGALAQKSNPKLAGKILIKTEDLGKAYYYYPVDLKTYYLGRPADAFKLMQQLGLGISNQDLAKLPINLNDNSSLYSQMELDIHNLINQQRLANSLPALTWNSEVAAVAREHSQDQANENQVLINNNKQCSYPMIHHEGLVFGIYHNQRLNNRGIYYFGASGENIALIPQIKEASYQSFGTEPTVDCQAQINQLNQDYETTVNSLSTDAAKINLLKTELVNRQRLTEQSKDISLTDIVYNNFSEIESAAVTGWMNSPGHRKNILNPAYTEAGIGIAQVKNYFIITQVFIQRVDCGFKNGACCTKPGYYPYCYTPLSCNANKCQ